mgnify:CR=1 FL=1
MKYFSWILLTIIAVCSVTTITHYINVQIENGKIVAEEWRQKSFLSYPPECNGFPQ